MTVDAFFWVASRMKASASPPRTRGSTSCVRRRGARSCAEIRRCRAAAAPDRLGFHLAQAVGAALQWSWPQVRIVVPVPSHFIRSRNLGHYRPKCGPKQDRNLNSLFGRENSLFFAENSLFTPKNSLFHCVENLAASPLNLLAD